MFPRSGEAEKLVRNRPKARSVSTRSAWSCNSPAGWNSRANLRRPDHKIFLDIKLHDIDNTIEKAVRNVAKMGMTFMTLHAYPKTMRAAVKGLAAEGNPNLCLLGVTVLTSMDEDDLTAAGYRGPIADLVEARARDAREAGMGGIVCAATEAEKMRAILGGDLVIVTPGIRPAGSATGDQRRVMTPADAIKSGSDYLVVGRPISQADDPGAAAAAVVRERSRRRLPDHAALPSARFAERRIMP